MSEISRALLRREGGERFFYGSAKGACGPGGCGAQDVFEFGERLLDGIEVWTVGRKIDQLRPGLFNGLAYARDFVDGQIVHDDDIAVAQRGDEHPLHIGEEQGPVHCSVENEWRGDATLPQSRDEGHRLPVAERLRADEPLALGAAPVTPRHAGIRARLVEEDKLCSVKKALAFFPHGAICLNVRPVLLAGPHRFFYS